METRGPRIPSSDRAAFRNPYRNQVAIVLTEGLVRAARRCRCPHAARESCRLCSNCGTDTDVREGPILLQKSFSTTDQNFSGLLMRFLDRYLRDLILRWQTHR